MPPSGANFPALRFSAEEQVDDPFRSQGHIHLADAIEFFVNTYLAIVDQAGARAAELVESLPYAREEGGYVDAFMALHTLRRAREALLSILEQDAVIKGGIESYQTTTREEDAEMRRKAREHDLEYGSAGNTEYTTGAKAYDEGRPSDDDIADSAAGGNRRALDANVADAQDQHPASAQIHQYASNAERGKHEDQPMAVPVQTTVDSMPTPPVSDVPVSTTSTPVGTKASGSLPVPALVSGELDDPALRLFGERPRQIVVHAPDFSKYTPGRAFRGAAEWLFGHIIKVAAGSEREGSFPRIAPLISRDIPIDYAISLRELNSMVADVRNSVSQLRVPGEGDGGNLLGLLDGVDPRDPDALRDVFRKITEHLGGRRRDRDSAYSDSAQEDGGWRESDTESESWDVGKPER